MKIMTTTSILNCNNNKQHSYNNNIHIATTTSQLNKKMDNTIVAPLQFQALEPFPFVVEALRKNHQYGGQELAANMTNLTKWWMEEMSLPVNSRMDEHNLLIDTTYQKNPQQLLYNNNPKTTTLVATAFSELEINNNVQALNLVKPYPPFQNMVNNFIKFF